MPNQMIFIRRTLYDLKRRYPASLEIYTFVSSGVNLETGEKVVVKTVYKIRRVILLPRQTVRVAPQLLGGEQFFRYGGLVDQRRRSIVIDVRDYPKEYEVRPTDYALVNGHRYNIKEAVVFDHRQAVLLSVEETVGEQPAAIDQAAVQDELNITQSGTGIL